MAGVDEVLGCVLPVDDRLSTIFTSSLLVQPVSQIITMATSILFENKVMMFFIDEMIGDVHWELTSSI
jgi:hypothetical protein